MPQELNALLVFVGGADRDTQTAGAAKFRRPIPHDEAVLLGHGLVHGFGTLAVW